MLSQLEPKPSCWLAAYSKDISELQSNAIPGDDNYSNWDGEYRLGFIGDTGSAGEACDRETGIKVIFDGHLHNREEILDRLGNNISPSFSNAEILLHEYLNWGEEVKNKIRGIYVVLIADRSKESLYCIRDRIGGYPLYYADTPKSVYLSTSINALYEHPWVSGELNRAALAEYINYQSPFKDETYHKSICRLPLGYTMQIMGGKRNVTRYWQPIQPGSEINWLREDEIDDFFVLLKNSVNPFLNFGQTGVHLTGGIDSSSVTTIAADLCYERSLNKPVALSLIFPDPDINERIFQNGVVNTLGLDHITIPVEDTMAANGYLWSAIEANSKRSIPCFGTWTPAIQYLEMEAQRQGVNTILTGSGGDTIFSVNPMYTVDLIKSVDIKGFYNLLVTNKSSQFTYNPQLLFNQLWIYGLKPLFLTGMENLCGRIYPERLFNRKKAKLIDRIPSWIAPDPLLKKDLENRILKSININPSKDTQRGYYMKTLASRFFGQRKGMLREEGFETSMLTGLYRFSPLVNDELMEYLVRVPPHMLNFHNRSKGMARHMLANRYPRLGFDTQKKSHYTKFRKKLLTQEIEPAWNGLGGAPALAQLGVVDPDKLHEFAQKCFADQNVTSMYILGKILQTELWTQKQ